MNIALFGSFGKRMLTPGWDRESAVSVFGSGDFDLSKTEPGDHARLTAVAVFSGIDIVVDQQVLAASLP